MSQHLFLRAYIAGIVPPTAMSLLIYLVLYLLALSHSLITVRLPPVENVIVFPLVVIPNMWGIWNGIRAVMTRRLPLAIHGALLPIINFALAYVMIRTTNFTVSTQMMRFGPVSLLMTMAFYYLIWKYVVGFLNTLVDVD